MNNTAHRTYLAWLAEQYTSIRSGVLRLLGRQADGQIEQVELHTDLSMARLARRTEQYRQVPLPDSLLAAFLAEPLATGDKRFIGREQELNRLLAALDVWRKGRSTLVAVTGRQGSGLTSLLQQLATSVSADETWHYARLERRCYNAADTLAMLSELLGCAQPAESLEQLVETINALSPRVFVIDNGHFLASRLMGTEATIRCLGAIMVATQLRHFWVLGCEQQAWLRLDYIYQVGRYFNECIELSLFSEAELGRCMTERMRAAQLLPAVVQEGEEPEGEEQEALELVPPILANVLSDLSRFSEGKPDFAFFYFLDSLYLNQETQQLDARKPVQLDFTPLKQLASDELFTLAEVAANGELTIADHQAVFRSSYEKSWLLLEHLYHLCLLNKQQGAAGLVYRLMPLYSNVIARHLTNTNYLY